MTFSEACNMVCGQLPEGWNIHIDLERDFGDVELYTPFGETTDFPSNRENIEMTLTDALEYAQSEDKYYVRGPNPGQIQYIGD